MDRHINVNVLIYVLRQIREQDDLKKEVSCIPLLNKLTLDENKIHLQMVCLMNMIYSGLPVREKFYLHKDPFLTVCRSHLPDLELQKGSIREKLLLGQFMPFNRKIVENEQNFRFTYSAFCAQCVLCTVRCK